MFVYESIYRFIKIYVDIFEREEKQKERTFTIMWFNCPRENALSAFLLTHPARRTLMVS